MPAQKKDNRAFLFRCPSEIRKTLPFFFFYTSRCCKPTDFDWNILTAEDTSRPWYTILLYLFTVSFGNLHTLYSCILIYFSWKIFRDYVSIQYILPYLLPRPSSTRTQTSIETCALEAATLQRSWDSLSHHAESGILWILASQPKPVCLVARSHTAISEHALDSHLAATDAPVSDTSMLSLCSPHH